MLWWIPIVAGPWQCNFTSQREEALLISELYQNLAGSKVAICCLEVLLYVSMVELNFNLIKSRVFQQIS